MVDPTTPESPGFAAQLKAYEIRARTVDLQSAESQISVSDKIALQNAAIRRVVSYWIVGLFGTLNVITILVIIWLATLDQGNIAAKLIPASDRIVGTRVLIALLGATTVQLGTIAVIMARSVFRDD
jgi:hypothetical protein